MAGARVFGHGWQRGQIVLGFRARGTVWEGDGNMRKVRRPAGWSARIALLVCVALLVPLGQIMAQDDAGAIRFTHAEIVFPAAIQFLAGVSAAPNAISHGELTVSQDGDPLRTFEITDAAFELRERETATEMIVTWTLDAPPYPRPFAPLAYEWGVMTEDGALSTASGEVMYADTRFTWQTAGEPPLTLHWHNDRLNGAGIRAELEPVLAALRDHTDQAPAFEFAIYDPDAPLCPSVTDPQTGDSAPGVVSRLNEQVFDCSLAQHLRVYGDTGVAFIQRPTLGYTELRDLLATHMARDIYLRLWDEAGADVPAWFAEGLAALYRPRPDLPALGLVRAALEDGSTLPADALASAPPDDASVNERALWQAQSAVLVRYLADRTGPDAPFEVARALAEGEPFDDALAALDETLAAGLWDTWAQWAVSDEANRAAAWTLYEEPAPTPTTAPTVTPSATPRLTRTPSPAPTLTAPTGPDVTPTLLGNVAPQVIVGQAPTEVSVTRTNTPLPPGSLPSATPRPAPQAPTEPSETRVDETETLGVVLLASGGALLLIAIGLLLRQR